MHSFWENGLAVTYRTEGDKLTMTTGTGQSYTARTDGTEAPFKGDRGITSVSVRIDKRTLVESDMRNGRVIGTVDGVRAFHARRAAIRRCPRLDGLTRIPRDCCS